MEQENTNMATMEHMNAEDTDVLAQKHAKMTGHLQEREDKRQEKVQKRKDDKDESAVANETFNFFTTNFNSTKTEVEEGIANSENIAKLQLPSHFDDLLVLIQKMQKYLTDSIMFLPSAYNIERAQETIGKLQLAIQEKRDVLIPKKRFAFKGKKKSDKPTTALSMEVKKKEVKVDISECNFSDIANKTLIKKAEEVNNQDVALTRLTNCTIKLYGCPGAVHINHLDNCTILCGPVSGSIFIDQCVKCKFIMGCQQMRIHSTSECDFYIHVTSKAIIEDCQMVHFAPYNWTYPAIEQHYELSGLDKSRNNWNDVDDFNWLASDSHSPNWSEIPESCRTTKWDM